MKNRLFHIFSAFMILSMFLTACSGAGAQAEVKTPLRVGWILWPGFYPLVIAEEKGFFEAQGVEVELLLYESAAEETAALASGMVDGGIIALNDALLDTIAHNAKVVLITDNSAGGDQIVATADITSAESIQFKNIGVKRGSFGEFFIREMLNQKGIQPSDVTFVNVEPEHVAESMPSYISLGHTYEPFTSQALAQGYKVIFSSADTPGLIVDTIAFRRTVINERPEEVRAFIEAWFEAVQYWEDHPEESNALIAEATGQPVESISLEGVKLFDRMDNLNAFKPGTDSTSIYFTARKAANFLVDSGLVAKPADINDVLDDSFLR